MVPFAQNKNKITFSLRIANMHQKEWKEKKLYIIIQRNKTKPEERKSDPKTRGEPLELNTDP